MLRNRGAKIVFFAVLFATAASAAFGAKLNMMSDASIIAFLSQSLGGDIAIATIAWDGMGGAEKQKVRDDASRLLKIAAEARKKFGNKRELEYQVEWFRASLLAEIYAGETIKSADLSEGPRVRFRQIVSASEEDAKKIYTLVLSPKSNFGTIAKGASIDASSANGGEVGWMPREKLPSDFAQKLFSAELNRVQPPVKLGDEWVVFEVLEREDGTLVENPKGGKKNAF